MLSHAYEQWFSIEAEASGLGGGGQGVKSFTFEFVQVFTRNSRGRSPPWIRRCLQAELTSEIPCMEVYEDFVGGATPILGLVATREDGATHTASWVVTERVLKDAERSYYRKNCLVSPDIEFRGLSLSPGDK